MRCTQCDKRNSVAAKQCVQCGSVLKTKPIPLRLKLYAGFAVGLILLIAVGFALMSHVVQSETSLSAAVKALATKTTSPEESTALFVTLDHALENYLKQHAGLSRDELIKTLQSQLPATGFEVHVFDLPQKLKLVEVDFGLAVYDYLLYGSLEGTKVTPVTGLGVYEDGTVIGDLAQPTLVLLGHVIDGNVHKPCVKAYSLLLERSVDQTDKLVPKFDSPTIATDGTIKFADNRKDIVLPLVATTSVRRSRNGKHRGTVVTKSNAILVWNNGKYSFGSANQLSQPTTPVASAVKPPEASQQQPEATLTKIAEQTPPVEPAVAPATLPKTATSEATANKQPSEEQLTKSDKAPTIAKTAPNVPAKANTSPSKEPGNGTIIGDIGSVKMRRGPGTSNSIVTELGQGSAVQVIGRNDSWYKVRANGQEGYVYAGLIDYDQKYAYKIATVRKNMRIYDDRSRLLEMANVGDRLVVLRTTRHGKYKVQLANGTVGYLDRNAFDQAVAVAAAPVNITPSTHRSSSSHSSSSSVRSTASSVRSTASSTRSTSSTHDTSLAHATPPATPAAESEPPLVP